MALTRREFIQWLSASAGMALGGCASMEEAAGAGRVVVIGGGLPARLPLATSACGRPISGSRSSNATTSSSHAP